MPVKTYSRAKSRLDIPDTIREELCHMMLVEVLHALTSCTMIREIVVVTQESRAAELCGTLGVTVLRDEERGVNEAVGMADAYLERRGAPISVVIPQDVPLLEGRDVSFLLKFFTPPTCVMVVPSGRFDGTNALLRCPPRIMGTHYDMDSYRHHTQMARDVTPNNCIVYVDNLMQDIDTIQDLERLLQSHSKPHLVRSIRALINQGA